MTNANATTKGLLGLTLIFSLIAALSFAAFSKTDTLCSQTQKCNRNLPAKRSGGMLWDDLSRHFISVISPR